jgi:hypothetical protein
LLADRDRIELIPFHYPVVGVITINYGNSYPVVDSIVYNQLPFPPKTRQQVKRSFYHYRHWLTMWRELWNLDRSSYQVSQVKSLGNIPLVSIKAHTFFKRSIWNFYMPIQAADTLRDQMHAELLKLSSNCTQIAATQSSHFVWVDEPEIIVAAIQTIL